MHHALAAGGPAGPALPGRKVDPSVRYVDDDPIITSAGTAAGIDACLYLVRREQGSRVANAIARRMVVPQHHDGADLRQASGRLPGSRLS